MDQFDDNGWNEIWEIFGKDQTRSPYSDGAENDSVGDEFWFEETGEIPDKLEITSAWPERTNENGKQFKSYDEFEPRDEYPKNDSIPNEIVDPTPLSECHSEIYEEYDSNEASLVDAENDLAGQKFTSDANDEIIKECGQDDSENDPVEHKVTSDANDEMTKECDQDDFENDPVEHKFTSDANDEMIKECDQDDSENDPVGQKFPSDANDEMMKECDQDDSENDPVGQKFTSAANDEMMKECDQDDSENDPVGQKFTSDANDEMVKECDNDNAEQEFKSTEKQTECDKSGATPDNAEPDISPNEIVPAEPDDVLPAVQGRYKSHEVLKHNTSSNKERTTSNGISRYKILLVGNLFQFTLIESRKASSIKILFQTLCLIAGFFSGISGVRGESISPQDTFAAVGTTVRFQCSWDLKKPVYWEWTPIHSKTGLFLYIGNGGLVDSADDRITIDIDKDKGRYDLVITGVLMKHAGTYNCIENSGLGKSMSAELTVLDEWNCGVDMPPGGFMGENVVSIPEDIILAFCSLHFLGNKDPTIRWSLSSNVTHKNATMTSKSASTITTSFSMRPTKELDKSVLIAYVDGSGDSSLTAGGLSWRSEILTVNYVHFVKGPKKSYREDAKNVLCHPECVFYINATYNGATYRYGDRNYEIPRAFDDDTPLSEGESKWLIMLILSILFFAASLCLLLFVVVFYARFRHTKAVCAKDGSATTAESETQGSRESEEFIKVSA